MKNAEIKSFKSHLDKLKQNPEFASAYDEEKSRLSLAIRLAEFRQSKKLSQTELARQSGITQQQLSKLERGENCNLTTFLKVCNTLGIEIKLHQLNYV
jgi:DNA-binding Xre family transcriptional regulator